MRGTRTILFFVVVTLGLFFITAGSYASEAEILLKMLLKKGIVTQAEYDEVMEDLKSADSIESRVEAIENKTDQVSRDHGDLITHIDKHITHAEGPAVIGGINVAAGITIVGQGTSGNDENTPPGDDAVDGNISADIELSGKLGEQGEAFMALETGDGTGLAEELDAFWGFNADAGPSATVEITEAWYEHQFSEGLVTLTIGKLNLTNYFDVNEVANDETTQFLSDGFVNNITVEFVDGPALRLTASPSELIDISIAAQSDGWDDLDEKNFLIAGANIKPKFGELQGNYRLYVWTNGSDHTDVNDATKTGERGTGYGISADQQILENLMLFARLGIRDDDLTEYAFDTAWSGGLALTGSAWGRDNDVLGLAYGESILANHKEDALRAAGTTPGNEGHFEVYYSLALNEYVVISPDIQIITNAKGDNDYKTVVAGALRGQFTF